MCGWIITPPYLDTPTAVAFRADTDKADIGFTQQLWYGLWGSAAGHYTRYGVHGDADVARTAGWGRQPALEHRCVGWACWRVCPMTAMPNTAPTTTPAPAPHRRPSCRWASAASRTMAVTATLSSNFWNGLWFSAYAGYVVDRFASDGLLAGIDLHYTPAPGVDLALGVRQSAVSYTQGEVGRQTTAGPQPDAGAGRAATAQLDGQPVLICRFRV